MTYCLTLILAFCSVVYELLLGQTLSAFLGNTVLRYSVTIGLYMLSMGIGALFVRERMLRIPVTTLLVIELGLAILGGYSLGFLFLASYAGLQGLGFSLLAHSLIIVIGILTGIEIPLLMAIRAKEREGKENRVLGVDYIGAFFGTLAFAFVFYPQFGLTLTGFSVAAVNAFVGLLLLTKHSLIASDMKKKFSTLMVAQVIIFASLCYCIWHADVINEYYISLYLS